MKGKSTIFSKSALLSLQNEATTIQGPSAFFPVRTSPNLTDLPFLPYWITPLYPNWCGISIIPVFNPSLKEGVLGVELVSPEIKIVHQDTIPLASVEPSKPVYFPFPSIRESDNGLYETRVFVWDTRAEIRVLESRFLPPTRSLRRWRSRLLCKLSFQDQMILAEHTGSSPLPTSPLEDELTLELAATVGTQSFKDHYFVSGWQTANIQLLAELQPNDSVLDIGCGVGRLAHGLHGWFEGRYVGTDIILSSIEYCKKTFPRFEFHHMDVKSPYYNPEGSLDPAEMVLPVENQSFDLAVLYSVYSHLLPPAFLRMTAEVKRILKPNGRCLATFFILDRKTKQALYSFRHRWSDDCRFELKETPEAVVAYTKNYVIETFAKNDLELKIHYPGAWTGRWGLNAQDQILFVKR